MPSLAPIPVRDRLRWSLAPPAPPEFSALLPEFPPLVASLCYRRGLRTKEAVDAFLKPDYEHDLHDPFLFRDMARAVDRVFAARDRGERVLIHGDYDADGVSGATVLLDTLEAIGCATDVFIPHRERDGYGFGSAALAYARERDARVMITCDCGIANADTVRAAESAGMNVIVTDHHLIPVDATTGAAVLPPAYAILHPKVAGETYPFLDLTGGGVAFKFCQGIIRRDAESSAPRLPTGFEKWLLDCVAISTVADFGPLLGENRTLVTYGLIVLQKTRRLGLRAMYDVAGIRPERITPATIGFQIAPRINAAGRLDHANEALALLRATDAADARALAERLHATNTERQRLVEIAATEAIAQVGAVGDRRFLVVTGTDWAPGIVGLVATRVRERFHRPTIALTHFQGQLLGSGRSIAGFDIVAALRTCADLLAAFGGHPQACGLRIARPEDLAAFTERLDAYAAATLQPEDLVPSLTIDAELAFEDVSWELVALLERFGPFGVGNPTPRYLARGVTVDAVTAMGNGGKHLRLLAHHRTSARRKLVVFCAADICPNVRAGDTVDVVFEVDVNEWNGNREIQMKVVDMQPHGASV